ncbi:transposable element tcb2 transposase [Trichonephila clavipes]|nr:transposable element tcb2 transposase [Trichonephila clavipes]
MDLYGYGDNLMNPWTLHVNRELFKLKYSSEFRHFRWPPKSPDMNIIEHIDSLQRAIQKSSPPSLTLADLWTALQDSWCQLPPELLQILIEFIQRHFAAFLRARWGPMRY